MLAKLIFWAVMLLVILLIANVLGLDEVSGLFAELLSYIPNVIAAVIILLLGMVLGEFVKDLVLASAGAMHGGPTLARASKGAVIVLAVFMALEQLNITEDIVLVAFMAIMGAAALAAGIAFGLRRAEDAAEIADSYRRTREAHAAAAAAETIAQQQATSGRASMQRVRPPPANGRLRRRPSAPAIRDHRSTLLGTCRTDLRDHEGSNRPRRRRPGARRVARLASNPHRIRHHRRLARQHGGTDGDGRDCCRC